MRVTEPTPWGFEGPKGGHGMSNYLVRRICVSCSRPYGLRTKERADGNVVDVIEGYCSQCRVRKQAEIDGLNREGPGNIPPKGRLPRP